MTILYTQYTANRRPTHVQSLPVMVRENVSSARWVRRARRLRDIWYSSASSPLISCLIDVTSDGQRVSHGFNIGEGS